MKVGHQTLLTNNEKRLAPIKESAFRFNIRRRNDRHESAETTLAEHAILLPFSVNVPVLDHKLLASFESLPLQLFYEPDIHHKILLLHSFW